MLAVLLFLIGLILLLWNGKQCRSEAESALFAQAFLLDLRGNDAHSWGTTLSKLFLHPCEKRYTLKGKNLLPLGRKRGIL